MGFGLGPRVLGLGLGPRVLMGLGLGPRVLGLGARAKRVPSLQQRARAGRGWALFLGFGLGARARAGRTVSCMPRSTIWRAPSG
eukprot:scaffold98326_cov63-Phaeocystis_antarctica.AAC.3